MTASDESVRRRAAALFARGASRAETARRLDVSRASATRWYRLWRAGGEQALGAAARGGRPARLTSAQLEGVQAALARSPREAGFALERWSLAAIACLIERATGVVYHPRHVPRVLRRTGWVVPPVGASARHAFRHLPHVDPDGNRVLLRQTALLPAAGDP